MDLKEFLEKGQDHFLPNLSIDLVIIGQEDSVLKCLLLQIGDKWILPGGFIQLDESVQQAVERNLRERTGLENPHFKFLSVFGDSQRKFSHEIKEFLIHTGQPWNDDFWLNTRFVTLAYYSLVNIGETHPTVSNFDKSFAWFSLDELPDMWMDHASIVQEARKRLKEDIISEHISYNLLPEQFTMPELHQLHESILEEKLDRSRFQKKMLASGRFKRLPKLKKETPGRNPYQYSIRK
ncbi:NUDIX hydrolase [Fulvivirga sedimenti]|uniref:NUDIX domain-containing protein n=1 Tax=Fulvivirga sedimenti TaxID=2879465 RepID=A0A9X1HNG3_9BACT|nr:NUDIX domain-containing protein [Fulvivirga sedimenti]MCA6075066.1 NUDIX domain-containing protein [Fulvivirga sedimenti]MCA6076243.1 NUDIX domain-containing protein [Fulvivirga sedimenti]MCA6077371.1 NUDIX domain-containing protein [Fulvivirga sedimenti]